VTLEEAILAALEKHPKGLTRAALQKATRRSEQVWTFRRALKALEDRGALRREGQTRGSLYLPGAPRPDSVSGVFSSDGTAVIAQVSRPLHQRTPCSYERSFLDDYRPNKTFYLRELDRLRLRELGTTPDANQPAGTWARHILERLLIDLSWNSSRLEGNTYSLLDTERLFRDRSVAEGHAALETQMLLNHKQAIEYLVSEASTLRLEPRVLRTLHGMLSENLLSDAEDEGRLRRMPVGIRDSTYLPLAVPQQIEELFTQLLATAATIDDPFEQSFFLLVHIPYLQPFADVNKRTSRLAANLPLLQRNLQPLSFVDLPREAYTSATLGLYELRRIEALRDVYLWSYQRSAERYRAIVKSMGEPDAFRLKYRDALRAVVRAAVQELPAASSLESRVAALAEPWASAADLPRFIAAALRELKNLNEGTFHRYALRPSEFERWSKRS
jgi:Fic family protein